MAYVDSMGLQRGRGRLMGCEKHEEETFLIENILKIGASKIKPSFCVVTKELNKLFTEVTEDVGKCAHPVTQVREDSRKAHGEVITGDY